MTALLPLRRTQNALLASELVVADGLCPRIAELTAAAEQPLLSLGDAGDPIEAISTALAASGAGLHTLHLVAHGRPGAILLGGQWIDAAGLATHAAELGRWGVARIALWSCETGADAAFVALLEELTGAEVWRSSVRLGAGHWQLESSTSAACGSATAPAAPFSAASLATWPHQLAEFAFTKAFLVTNEAGKETNFHQFDPAAPITNITISDETRSRTFSGNDVSVKVVINGTTILYGWISRPIKVGGVVRGFYFWTDPQFTTMALAQADGNADADNNALDNSGYVFVVDDSYFTTGGIGSSSDRVDAALNGLVNANVNPVANNDTATAYEAGVGRDGTNAVIGGNTAYAGGNASGNVLTNDTDANGDTLTVVEVGTSSASLKAVASGSTSASGGTAIAGTYGTLTLGANGTYSYAINNTNPTVNALQVGSTLTETFRYAITDGKGGTSSANLTITLQGTNDQPVANVDYDTAEETVTGLAGSGYSATGNVLTNDTDVDTGDTKPLLESLAAPLSPLSRLRQQLQS